MGETRVDLLHLLEDLRDAYPGALEETILTEIMANSLDSGASRICLHADSTESTLTVVDNGSGMQRRDLGRYHDIAASTKTRGCPRKGFIAFFRTASGSYCPRIINFPITLSSQSEISFDSILFKSEGT